MQIAHLQQRFVLIIFRINLKKYYYAIVAAGWSTRLVFLFFFKFQFHALTASLLAPALIFMLTAIGLNDTEPGIGWY